MSNDKLAEALRDAEATVLAFLGDVAFDGSVCGIKQAIVKGMFARLQAHAAEAAQAQAQSDDLHPATADLVGRFAAALHDKLLAAQRKYGYADNWQRDDWMDECREHLRQHLEKGDPRDVAAYCAFLWHHGAPTVANKSLTQLRAECKDAAPQQAAEPVRQFRVVPKGSVWTDVKDPEIWASVITHPESYETRVLYTRPQPAQDAKDAARYRWLRDSADSYTWDYLGGIGAGRVDAAIDAAMAKESGR